MARAHTQHQQQNRSISGSFSPRSCMFRNTVFTIDSRFVSRSWHQVSRAQPPTGQAGPAAALDTCRRSHRSSEVMLRSNLEATLGPRWPMSSVITHMQGSDVQDLHEECWLI
eukprot:768624-Hanusia_phi.AAC.2